MATSNGCQWKVIKGQVSDFLNGAGLRIIIENMIKWSSQG